MPENLIRLKQLNQPEITGLFQSVISTNSYALTYGGGTGVNIQSVSDINLENVNINISGGSVIFDDTTQTNLDHDFPPSTGIRRYFPEVLQSTFTTSPTSGFINYYPFIMKKTSTNPRACIELVTWGSDNLVKFGAYSGQNGIEGANLFWSGSMLINRLSTTGVNRITIPHTFKKGETYIIASMNFTGLSNSVFRAVNTSHSRLVYGENTGVNILGGNSTTSTTVHLYETGIDLRNFVGTGFWSNTSAGMSPLVCLEY